MKKDIILETAARLFAEKGYARTSTAILAKESGVAEGTIFRHFKSKEHIFIALVQRLREKMTRDVHQFLDLQSDEHGLDRIISVIRACYSFVQKNSTDFALLLRDVPGCYGEPHSPAFEHARIIYVSLQEDFQASIEKGQRDGTIRDDIHAGDTACILASSLVGLMRVVHLGFLTPSSSILKNFVQTTVAMLEAPK